MKNITAQNLFSINTGKYSINLADLECGQGGQYLLSSTISEYQNVFILTNSGGDYCASKKDCKESSKKTSCKKDC